MTNGLVFHLDSDDTNSYPGSGDTWTDLASGIENDCTGYQRASFPTMVIPPSIPLKWTGMGIGRAIRTTIRSIWPGSARSYYGTIESLYRNGIPYLRRATTRESIL